MGYLGQNYTVQWYDGTTLEKTQSLDADPNGQGWSTISFYTCDPSPNISVDITDSTATANATIAGAPQVQVGNTGCPANLAQNSAGFLEAVGALPTITTVSGGVEITQSNVGGWMTNTVEPLWGTAMNTGSPLVLDLSSDGSGITLAALNGAGSVYWDFGDGFKHASGWVTGTTGILCIDPTGTGVITQADLFGNNGTYANGFDALAAFAGTTGVLDSSNSVFSELRVWVPSAGSDGVSQSSDLYTLTQLGITSINLNYTSESYQINGNNIEEQSTFVINGNTQTIADAWFANDPVNTVYDGSWTLNPAVTFLPDQRGYGDLPELAISMSMDSTLLSEVDNLASQSFSQLMDPSFGLENALKAILYEWAGVENVDPNYLGTEVNAQHLAFLEQLMGQYLWNNPDLTTLDGGLVVGPINATWDAAFAYLSAHLLAQAGFNDLMGNPTYGLSTDTLYINGSADDVAVQFADQAAGGTELQHLATNDIFVLFPGDAPLSSPYNSPTLSIAETANGGGTNTLVLGVVPSGVTLSDDSSGNVYVHYTSTDTVEILAGMALTGGNAAGTTVGEYIQQIAFSDGTIISLTGGLDLTATSIYPTVYGSAVGGDTLDGSGITGAVLRAYTGDETFIAGPDSTMDAGAGTNSYVINPDSCPASSGGAIINPNASATGDAIVLHDVTPSQVSVYDNTSGQLLISTVNGDLVSVNGGSYYEGFTPGNVAQIDFDNGHIWSLSGVVALQDANSGALYGFTSGSNFIADGASNSFYGFSANDVFSFTSGSSPASAGGDNIYEYASVGSQTIAFHGLLPSAVAMSDDSSGDLMFQFGTDLVTLHMGNYAYNGVTIGNLEQATFDNGTVWDLQNGLDLTATSNSQTLYGSVNGGDVLTADGYYDYLHAYGGTETLVANSGAYLYNGSGTDTDVFSAGAASTLYGGDTIYDSASGSATATIAFHGIDPSAVTMWDNSSGQLFIQYSSTDQIAVNGGSYSYTGFNVGSLSEITFDNSGHTVWTTSSGLVLTADGNYQTLYGTTGGGDTMTAAGTGDYLYGYGGNETMVVSSTATDPTIYNGTGNDTDVFSSGFGTASLYANASGGSSNCIDFHGVTASQLTFADNSYGQFLITDSSGDVLTVNNGNLNWSTGFAIGNIQQVALDGGTDISLTGSLDLTATGNYQAIYGSGHGDQLTAQGNGDYLYGIAGNNTMTGAANSTTYFEGGSGNDTMTDGGGTATNYMNAGTGADTYNIESPNSSTTISGYNPEKGDVLNVEDIMTGYDPVSDALGNWVQETVTGGNTQISVDPTGQGHFTSVNVVLSGVTSLPDIATLVAEGALKVHG
jgi:hypothetical protein